MKFRRLTRHFGQSAPLSQITAEQTGALLDLIIYALAVDGVVSAEETAELQHLWADLPFPSGDKAAAQFNERAQAVIGLLEGFRGQPDLMDEFVRERAQAFRDPSLRRDVLKLVAALTRADGIDADEMRLCFQLGEQFELKQDDIAQIIADVF